MATYKFGILRWLDGQNEDAAFSNESSALFDAFLDAVGTRIELKGWSRFRGGLNVSGSGETGTHSLFTESHGMECMFHVSTMLPLDPKDAQKVALCSGFF